VLSFEGVFMSNNAVLNRRMDSIISWAKSGQWPGEYSPLDKKGSVVRQIIAHMSKKPSESGSIDVVKRWMRECNVPGDWS
jgi:hypothetical protein